MDINNSYSIDNYITFDKFKEIFFKLPYLSDLIRVSFSYMNEEQKYISKEFDSFKVIIEYVENINRSIYSNNNNNNYGTFYFPNNEEEDEINNNDNGNIKKYEMNTKIKISYTVDYIIMAILRKINNKIRLDYNERFILDNLKSFDKISCYIYYYLDENSRDKKIKEKIGYFDRLYSCSELKNKHYGEIKLIFNTDLISFNTTQNLVMRGKGYCKIFYSNNNDFIWKKCNVKSKDICNAKLSSVDYKSKPLLNKNDVVLAYNI